VKTTAMIYCLETERCTDNCNQFFTSQVFTAVLCPS